MKPEEHREAWEIASKIKPNPTAADVQRVAQTIKKAVSDAPTPPAQRKTESGPPPGWDDEPRLTQAEFDAVLRTAADKGLIQIIRGKVEDRLRPILAEVNESLEEDERGFLPEAVEKILEDIKRRGK